MGEARVCNNVPPSKETFLNTILPLPYCRGSFGVLTSLFSIVLPSLSPSSR